MGKYILSRLIRKLSFLFALSLFTSSFLIGQVFKTISITPGSLSTALTSDELATITSLTLTGTMDARDFKTIRNTMPALSILDLSDVVVSAYNGPDGTNYFGTDYLANSIPDYAFYNRSSLSSILLPTTVTLLGNSAFDTCTGLTSIIIPLSVTTIGQNTFYSCRGIASITVPPLVTKIGQGAFFWFNGNIIVDESNPNYSSLDGILFDKNKSKLIECPISKTGSYVIPSSVTSIAPYAFAWCNKLSSITIPSSVNSIEGYVFVQCTGLISIYSNLSVPVNVSSYYHVFNGIDFNACTLYVPFGTLALYSVADQWKDFTKMSDIAGGFSLSSVEVILNAAGGSNRDINIYTNEVWAVISNQPWLTVSPTSGSHNGTINLSANENTGIPRIATVTISSVGFPDQTISVTQLQVWTDSPLNITSGGLSTALSAAELNTITNLTLMGSIDARDFKTMRDNMPALAELDLSGVTIVSYTGTEGTAGSESTVYAANTIPANAFYYSALSKGKTSLVSVILPSSTQAIGNLSFLDCYGLTSFTIPPSVTTLGVQSLSGCTHLGAVNIPASVTSIGNIAFVWSSGLITVDESNPNYSAVDGILFDKGKSVLIHCPTSKIGSYSIPNTVSTIKNDAFNSCNRLNSITIPSTVKSIGTYAFTWCTSLSSIYSNTSLPVNLSSSIDVFYNINKSTCTLYVPFGTSGLYRAANKWQDFTNITEAASGFSVSSNALTLGAAAGSNGTVNVTSNVSWSVISDQPWLTPNPTSASNNGTITLTATQNTGINRFGTVTVRSVGFDDQMIIVTQQGIPVNITHGGLAAFFSAAELATIVNLKVTGSIDARDFKTMRDNMPLLEVVDLSEALIYGYTGTDGTAGQTDIYYPSNTIPDNAFYNGTTNQGKNTLISVILPNSATSVGIKAFRNCTGLSSIILPSALQSIKDYAFSYCQSLISIEIPSSVWDIENQSISFCTSLTFIHIPASANFIMYNAFEGSSGLIIVDQNNPNYSDLDGVLFDKSRSILIHFPISRRGSYVIPSTVTTLWQYAFSYCSSLNSLTIPGSVNAIGHFCFYSCTGLSSIYSNSPVPINLSSSDYVFLNANKSTCVLNVPYGTSGLYHAANQWQEFTNISEASEGFSVSATNLSFVASGENSTVNITANVTWNVQSNQSWLIASPISGTNSSTILLTASENKEGPRNAIVTISSQGFNDQIITISQSADILALPLAEYRDINTPVVDESSTIVIGNEQRGHFKFMPLISGVYTFSSISSCEPVGELYDDQNHQLIYGYDQSNFNFNFSYNLTAGKVYYFAVISLIGNNQNVQVNISGGGLQHLWLNPTSLTLASVEGTNAAIDLKAKNSWSAVSDQPWLSVTPSLGLTNGTVTLTAIENTGTTRTATVTFSSAGSMDQTIIVTQTRPDTPIPLEAGQLSAVLTASDMLSMSKLKLTGTIDARDFKTMRDNMPALTDIDLSGATVVAYTGTGGTYDSNNRSYPANVIPENALSNKNLLTTIVLPPAIISIGSNAFSNCFYINTIEIPLAVTSIGLGAFSLCRGLTSISIPIGVTTIGSSAFYFCTNLTSVTLPSSVTEIGADAFYNNTSITSFIIPPFVTSIGNATFANCTSLTSITIPSNVASIGQGAFYGCAGLTSIAIPVSVLSIGRSAFYGCTGLTSIDSYAVNPPDLPGSTVFGNVNTSTCSLNVSYNSSALYRAADQWKDFIHISEMPGFRLSALSYTLGAEGGSFTDDISANVTWNGSSDQTWLNITPASLAGNGTISLVCNPNGSVATRSANVIISSSGVVSQTIKVIQEGIQKVQEMTAGDLFKSLTAAELSSITKLKIKGTIDARDFKTMRDNMPMLIEIDLSETSVADYTGTEGTGESVNTFYPANAIPNYAFSKVSTLVGKTSLKSIILPPLINAIGNISFYGCTGLISISLPSFVSNIGWEAFEGCTGLKGALSFPSSLTTIRTSAFKLCTGLTSVNIPVSVTLIENNAFSSCTGLFNVDEGNANYSSYEGVLFNKLKTTLLQCPVSIKGVYTIPSTVTLIGQWSFGSCSALTDVSIPSSVTTIGYNAFNSCSSITTLIIPSSVKDIEDWAFSGCEALTSINIPSAVTSIKSAVFYGCVRLKTCILPPFITSIGRSAFINCGNLTSFYSYSQIPVELSSSPDVFDYWIINNFSTLYVPFGTTALYRAANQWKDFKNIVEMPQLKLSTSKLSFTASGGSTTVDITSNTLWSSNSDQSWFEISPASFNGNTTLTVLVAANPFPNARAGKIAISAKGIEPQIIDVIQSGLLKTVNICSGGLFAALSAEELGTVTNLVIAGTIDARDFKTMRDYMPALSEIDLSGATVIAYNGANGTYPFNSVYAANEIPGYAFSNLYTNAGKVTLTSVALPVSVTSIGSFAFSGCNRLTSCTIPSSVTNLGDWVFNSCKELTSVTFSGSLTNIGNGTFQDCSGLTSVIIPNSVILIGSQAFQGCSGLISVILSSSCTAIRPNTFNGCSKMASIVLPPSVTSIDDQAFMNCNGLNSITMPTALLSIGSSAFWGCASLTSITIPPTVRSIGPWAFYSNRSLTSVILPPLLTTIERNTFDSCEKLSSVTIPSSVTTIQDGAFRFCVGLTSCMIPSSVTSIGTAFYCCGLTSLTIPYSITLISDIALYACTKLGSLSIPSSVTTIGNSAFAICRSLVSLYSYKLIPVNLSSSTDVFNEINKTTCLLNVPYGSSGLYAAADQWKDFTHIVEMPGFALSATIADVAATANSTVTVDISSNVTWTASSDQSWLTVSPTSGTGNQTLNFTAEKNPILSKRTAIVTVTANGAEPQTITVTQQAGVAEQTMQLSVILEGFYDGSGMMTEFLRTGSHLPLSQPYNGQPWNYKGTEHVDAIPPGGVVDWVLVELRQAATPAEALPETVLPGWPKALFVKATGSIVDLEGNYILNIGNQVVTGNIYVIIRHRNHIAIMSAEGMTHSGNSYTYNFMDAISKAYGGSSGYRQITSYQCGMVCGDANSSGEISVLDFTKWATDYGKADQYLNADINGDGQVSVLDFTKWATNFGQTNVAPVKSLNVGGVGSQPAVSYKCQVPGN